MSVLDLQFYVNYATMMPKDLLIGIGTNKLHGCLEGVDVMGACH